MVWVKQSTLCTTQFTLPALYQTPVDALKKRQKEWEVDQYLKGMKNRERGRKKEV